MQHCKTLRWSALGLLLLSSCTAIARPQGPPPEALDACSGRSAGTVCSFEAPHGTVSGSCRNTPGGNACVPAGDRGRPEDQDSGQSQQGRPGGPPPEAYTACQGKQDGNSCRVQTPHGGLDGRCHNHGDKPFCVPDDHGQRAGSPGFGRPEQGRLD